MRIRARAALFVAATVITSSAPLSAALACSVCLAGDPIFSEHGTNVQQPGDFSLYMEFSGFTKRSGALPGEHAEEEHEEEEEEEHGEPVEENDGQRLDLFLSWTPLDRLSLTLNLPFLFNTITETEGDEELELSLNGLGDMSFAASYVLWRNRDVLPGTWIEGRAFVKFPTGPSERKTQGIVDKHLQTGTGSWDFGFGLAGVHKFDWGSTYASVFGRINTDGALDYRYGDVVLANFATLVPLGHATGISCLERFIPGLEWNFRWAGFDYFRGQRFEDSGGPILYATPSLRIRLPWVQEWNPPMLRAAVQVPLTSAWLNGFQEEDERWSLGIQFPF